MTDQEKNIQMSALDIFASTQETFEEAKKKSSEESKSRATYLRIKNDGTYNVRILPLAPVVNAEGEVLPMERKGYEYPLRSLMLKIVEPQTDSKGKPKINYVSVCNATHAFKDKLKADLIDTYVNRVCEVHADDAALCKKLREGSFNGGLRWDSKRCMYVIDVDNPGDGIQILQLSYAQYKDLEERKLNVWNKLNKGGKNVPCPISSISNAYPVEIIRKTENGKASYSFNIDTLSGINALDEDACQKLLDKPRLPEVLYRYTRYHLEATIAYLTQLDEQHDIDMVNDEEVQNCIEQIKCLLPADDQSHFVLGRGKGSENTEGSNSVADIDSLWDLYDRIDEAGLDDKSAEGQELRTSIKEYIDANKLSIRISHTKSNIDLLQEIEDALAEGEGTKEADDAPVDEPKRKGTTATRNDENYEDDGDEPAAPTDEPEDAPEPEPEPEPAPARRTRERNDDTNEPAVRTSRRSARPQRRR